jgi:hypothetical protein
MIYDPSSPPWAARSGQVFRFQIWHQSTGAGFPALMICGHADALRQDWVDQIPVVMILLLGLKGFLVGHRR